VRTRQDLISPPRLRQLEEADGDRHASWLELFFDLVFVIAVAELGRLLHEDLSVAGFATFVALFVPVWWVWLSFAYYADLFDTDDLVFRVALMAGMLGSLVLAASIGQAIGETSIAFAATNAALQALLVALYAYARRGGTADVRRLCTRYVLGFALGGAIWLASLLLPAPGRYVLWAVALAAEIATPLLAYLTLRVPPAHASHLPERLGLFTLIVLGESIIAVAMGTTETGWALPSTSIAVLGFVAAGCLWWVYFDHVDESVISRAVATNRRAVIRGFAYGYGHLPIFAGLAAAGVGVESAIEHASDNALEAGARAALCGGVAVYLLALTASNLVVGQVLSRPVLAARLAVAALGVVLMLIGGWLSPLALVSVLGGGLVLLTLVEVVHPAPISARRSQRMATSDAG